MAAKPVPAGRLDSGPVRVVYPLAGAPSFMAASSRAGLEVDPGHRPGFGSCYAHPMLMDFLLIKKIDLMSHMHSRSLSV